MKAYRFKNIAKPGASVFYDTFAGPIAARLLSVVISEKGAPVMLDVELCESVGAYRAGEIIRQVAPRYVIPRGALRVGPCGVYSVRPFAWEMPA